MSEDFNSRMDELKKSFEMGFKKIREQIEKFCTTRDSLRRDFKSMERIARLMFWFVGYDPFMAANLVANVQSTRQ